MEDRQNPTCRACRKEVVVSNTTMLGATEPFFYCRTCKIEVDKFGNEVKPIVEDDNPLKELDDYLEEELNRLNGESNSNLDEDFFNDADYNSNSRHLKY